MDNLKNNLTTKNQLQILANPKKSGLKKNSNSQIFQNPELKNPANLDRELVEQFTNESDSSEASFSVESSSGILKIIKSEIVKKYAEKFPEDKEKAKLEAEMKILDQGRAYNKFLEKKVRIPELFHKKYQHSLYNKLD